MCVWERVEETFGKAWQQKVKSQHKCHRIDAILEETCSFLLLEISCSPTFQVNISLWCVCFVLVSLPAFLFLLSFPIFPTAQNDSLLPSCPKHLQHTISHLKISLHTSPHKRQQWMIEEKTVLVCLCECSSNQSKLISSCKNRMDASST